jgi:hypothetical protein
MTMTTNVSTPAQTDAVARLETAINLKDAAEVEAALRDVGRAGVDLGSCGELQARMCSLLIRLINAPWQAMHEVVAAVIAAHRCADAVPALEEAARASMRSNDAYRRVARMCTRAFARIGTPDARAALERLSKSGDAVIARYAAWHLARWERAPPGKKIQ